MFALPRVAPPTSTIAWLVVSVNSSILARVPGPALFDAMDATISPYCTLATRFTAATIGIDACPPQVTISKSGAPRCASPYTSGTGKGSIAAGLRSITRLAFAIRTSTGRAGQPDEVASEEEGGGRGTGWGRAWP